jgi:CTP:molybdopterin cytidylyltransferase MocA
VGVIGLVLAAGAGRRMGGPKALRRDPDGVSWVVRTARVLLSGGCDGVLVVVGAAADEVRDEVIEAFGRVVRVVTAAGWADGMASSLRAGLTALDTLDRLPANPADPTGRLEPVTAAMVALVDTPGLTEAVVARLLDATLRATGGRGPGAVEVLARATYHGVVGHPVLVGRRHWPEMCRVASGDTGARDYLATHEVTLVECAALGSGADLDTPADLQEWTRLTRHQPDN